MVKKVKTTPRKEDTIVTAQSTAGKDMETLNQIKEKVPLVMGQLVNDKYKVTQFIDDGTFGRCVLAVNLESGEEVILKMVKNY